ncbi:carboxylating nicotinate-nucleotide diphosphorylase [Nesterenkonia muleiensis]|uniref:carboxylating nicotinate-nucleotide diphosphorylase n=1 Tax=Nesterenkonia muleiensis TaxID=2282648 RepID=UPI000E739287|nr:carboxylating nicotinate-nucleotide diphosphorylase [Nesterenkonia muleiensis]
MSLIPLPASAAEKVIRLAVAEDAPFGDLTTESFVPEDARAEAVLSAREPGVLSGGPVFAKAMQALDAGVVVDLCLREGTRFEPGAELARVTGPARPILTCERIALNLVQRMSGVATLTSQYVAAVHGSGARIADTRKTTPGLRALERYAVRCGGGHNHRFGLSDAVLVKDNHLTAVSAADIGLAEAIRAAREQLPHTVHLEVEVDRLDQIPAVLDGGADTIMLDNFTLEDMRRGVELIAGQAVVEASGGVSLKTIGAIADTGVDVISVGALTHSAPALDLGLDFQVAR